MGRKALTIDGIFYPRQNGGCLAATRDLYSLEVSRREDELCKVEVLGGELQFARE
jgi:hypothetical protein